MNPPSNAVSLLLLLLTACAGAAPLDASATRRRPDGVAIDPTSAPPSPRDRADAADGLVTLRTPLGSDRAFATVGDFFRKIVVEDSEGLEPLFTRDALAVTSLAPGGGATPQAVLFWQGRFRKLDYTKLAGELVYRDTDMTLHRAEDLAEAPLHPIIRADAIGSSDVVVHVPILTARIGADRLFGDEMFFWLRRDGDRYRIYRIMEEFQLN